MKLSNTLVKQFAKNTSSKKTNKKETFVYGQITEKRDGVWYVKLDGTSIETPISDFTSTVDIDERVIVMIKNHNAVVTGNVGAPATSQSYVDGKGYINHTQEVKVNPDSTNSDYKTIQHVIGFDKDGKMVYQEIDLQGAEPIVTKTSYIATTDDEFDLSNYYTKEETDTAIGAATASVDLADIRALWPDCKYE